MPAGKLDSLSNVLGWLATLRQRLGPLWWYSLLMLGLSQIGNVMNFVVGAFLVPDLISKDELGAVLPLTRLASFVGVPLAIVVGTALKYMNVFKIKGETGKIKTVFRDLTLITIVLSVVVVLTLWWTRGFVMARLKFGQTWIVWVVGGLAVASCSQPVVETAAQGLKHFYSFIVSRVVGPAARLLLALVLLRQFQVGGYLWAQLGSCLAIIAFLSWGFRGYVGKSIRAESYREYHKEMFSYMLFVGVLSIAWTLQSTVEPWVVRQRLSEADSAGFYFAVTFGSIPSYLGLAVLSFLFPLVSEAHEKAQETTRMLRQAMLGIGLVGSAIVLLFVFFGRDLLQLRESWRSHADYSSYLWALALAATLDSIVGCHISHESACWRFGFLRYYGPLILLEAGLLYGLMGWTFFRPWLPDSLWAAVNKLPIQNLVFVVGTMVSVRVLMAAFAIGQSLMAGRKAYVST